MFDAGGGNWSEDAEEKFHKEMNKYLNRCIEYHQKILM
jgi:hypothetical protein